MNGVIDLSIHMNRAKVLVHSPTKFNERMGPQETLGVFSLKIVKQHARHTYRFHELVFNDFTLYAMIAGRLFQFDETVRAFEQNSRRFGHIDGETTIPRDLAYKLFTPARYNITS